MVSTASLLGARHLEDVVENHPESSLVVSLAEVYIGSGAGFQNQDYPVFSSDLDWIRTVNF